MKFRLHDAGTARNTGKPNGPGRPTLRRPVAILAAVLAMALAPPSLQAQAADGETTPGQGPSASVVGDWSGDLVVSGVKLPLVFHVMRRGDALAAAMDSPSQGARGIPVGQVKTAGGVLVFVVPSIGGKFEGALSPDGGTADGFWTQGAARLPLRLSRSLPPAGPADQQAAPAALPDQPAALPDQPAAPQPWSTVELNVPGGGPGVVLSGTLVIPEGGGPFPTVVMVSGSGPQDRDETILGKKPFLFLAEFLARRGIASFRYDDRGTGLSTGDFASATTTDLANDALAAVSGIASRPKIDPARLGVLGHSEGGLIAPMAAARDPRVRFIVLLAAPGIRGDLLILSQSEAILRASGAPEEQIAATLALNARLYGIAAGRLEESDLAAALAKAYADGIRDYPGLSDAERESMLEGADQAAGSLATPWFREFLSIDPRSWLSRVGVPVLALNGTKDLQVPFGPNLEAIRSALPDPQLPSTRIMALDGLNHLFQAAGSGLPDEYATLPETFSPSAATLVADWISSLPGPAAGRH